MDTTKGVLSAHSMVILTLISVDPLQFLQATVEHILPTG